MALIAGGVLTKLLRLSISGGFLSVLPEQVCTVQKREFAARKGTREKARKKKVKVEVKKVGFIPHNLRNVDKSSKKKRTEDRAKLDPIDNVFIRKFFKIQKYSIQDAFQCHRETHHPSIYNVPNAMVYANIELNMVAERKTRFVDSFNRITYLPHSFNHGQARQILVFCKTPELVSASLEAGADMVGGPDLIKSVQSGEVPVADYKYVLCHPNILPELVTLRGLLKRKFPSAKDDTLTPDLARMVAKYKRGMEYRVEQDAVEHDLGNVILPLGDLTMAPQQIEDNLRAILEDIELARPKREGAFITWVSCTSPPSHEKFPIDIEKYFKKEEEEDQDQQKLLENAQ